MTANLTGVAIQRAGTLYGVPTTEESYSSAHLAANAVDGLLQLLGRETFFKFQDKAFELAPGARKLDEVPLPVVIEALRFACDPAVAQVMELQALPGDDSGPVYR